MENVLNLILCSIPGLICVCRLGKMDGAKAEIRIRYILWIAMLGTSAVAPSWLGIEVNAMQMLFPICVLADLALGFKAWRNGQPKYVRAA